MDPTTNSLTGNMAKVDVTNNQEETTVRMAAISIGALAMAMVEAACAFLILVNGISALLGTSALAAAGGASALHSDLIRYPLLVLATLGAALNLFSLANAARLRNSPAASWRKKSLTRKQKIRNALVASASILTLIIVAGELWAHWRMHNHI